MLYIFQGLNTINTVHVQLVWFSTVWHVRVIPMSHQFCLISETLPVPSYHNTYIWNLSFVICTVLQLSIHRYHTINYLPKNKWCQYQVKFSANPSIYKFEVIAFWHLIKRKSIHSHITIYHFKIYQLVKHI